MTIIECFEKGSGIVSPGPYFEADEHLAQLIAAELYKRQSFNVEKVLQSPPRNIRWRDVVNPSLLIPHNEIKQHTGRAQLRESAYECLRSHFLKLSDLTTQIERDIDGSPIGLKITLTPPRATINEFMSLLQLREANEKETNGNRRREPGTR